MSLQDYANWLKSSWCHVYLSEPFVTSWSYIEALHCQIPMVASATNATIEFNAINKNLIGVNHKNSVAILEAINDRIRFSSNLRRSNNDAGANKAIQNADLPKTSETSLAMVIADVEATTKI